MLAHPGLSPDRPPSDRLGIGARQLPGPGIWPRGTPVDNSALAPNQRPPLHQRTRCRLRASVRPNPNPGTRLLKPRRAKARIGHDTWVGSRPATMPATVAETPGACAASPSRSTYAPLHTRCRRATVHRQRTPATENGVCTHPGPTNQRNNTGRVRCTPMSSRHRLPDSEKHQLGLKVPDSIITGAASVNRMQVLVLVATWQRPCDGGYRQATATQRTGRPLCK